MKRFTNQVWAFTLITFKENLRNNAYLILSLTGICLFLAAGMLANMAVGDQTRVVLDSGFWILGILGVVSSLVLGLNAVQNDLNKKIIYTMLSRPVDRWVYMSGKFAGILAMGWLIFITLSFILVMALVMTGTPVSVNILTAIGFIFLEWCVLFGFSILFASFTGPLLHALFLFSLYFIGHWASYLFAYARNAQDQLLENVLLILYYGFPNLEALNYRTQALYQTPIPAGHLVQSLGTGLGWTVTVFVLAVLIFNNRKVI